jgi:hypothetical protein
MLDPNLQNLKDNNTQAAKLYNWNIIMKELAVRNLQTFIEIWNLSRRQEEAVDFR